VNFNLESGLEKMEDWSMRNLCDVLGSWGDLGSEVVVREGVRRYK